ncbi:MAG: pyridoxamine 5'-phosphate oxidase family protein [Bacteroidales bacterium]|nr:pyridoxamine 5'-phosphate oxidase family protein [Bacteroidales bacterium]
MIIEKRVIDFIKEHHVLTLSTAVDNKSYSANCFYTYHEEDNALIFTSDYETKHIKDVAQNNYISGSIVLETSVVGKIQGIQFNGNMYEAKDDLLKKYKKTYLKRFPFAILISTAIWYIDLTFIKMTDNRLGFGKKLIWEKEN